MTQTKKILSILLSMILLFSVCPTGVFDFTAGAETVSGTCGDNLTWEYDTSTYTLTISGTGTMTNYSTSSYNGFWATSAPWGSYYNTMKTVIINSGVTSVGSYAFYSCTELTSVTIGNGVTSIGGIAFYGCTSLESFTIGNRVTSIGYDVFHNCTSLNKVNISDIAAWCNISFATYNSNPLYCAHNLYLNGKLVIDLVIPDSVTSIGSYAFSYCTGLTSVTIPDSVKSIGHYAFSGCTGLNTVYYPGPYAQRQKIKIDSTNNSLTSANWMYNYVGEEGIVACSTCGENLTWTLDSEGLLTVSGTGDMDNYSSASYYLPWYSYLNSIKTIIIPDSVTSIGEYAFYGCAGLTSVTIPDSVTSIGDGAFPKNTVIYGSPSTAAETFAYSSGNKFIASPDFIEVFSVKRTDYSIGSEMEPNSVIIAAYFSSGEVKFYYKNFTVSGFDTSKHGKKTVTVSYYGKEATFDINVFGATANDLTVLVDMILGKESVDTEYDYTGDGNVNILDLIKMKKEIANM